MGDVAKQAHEGEHVQDEAETPELVDVHLDADQVPDCEGHPRHEEQQREQNGVAQLGVVWIESWLPVWRCNQ